MITAPRFWWRERPSMAAQLLSPAAWLFGSISGARMRRPPSARAKVPVICIGNFTVGGAGKTPTALALARIANELSLRPGFLTRGYGGTVREPLRLEPGRHDAAHVGDEALLLAEAGPVVVSPDRPLGLPLLEAAGVDLILMDDGFQNPSLAKDWSLVVVDGAAGIGNGLVLPAGPLRAPFDLQLARADALLVVGEGRAGEAVARQAGRPVFRGRLEPVAMPEGSGAWLAFAGIGRPEKFFASVAAAGLTLRDRQPFPDHHVYSPADAVALLDRADREGLRLITTTKDRARLTGATGDLARLRERAEVLPVAMKFDDEAAIAAIVAGLIRR